MLRAVLTELVQAFNRHGHEYDYSQESGEARPYQFDATTQSPDVRVTTPEEWERQAKFDRVEAQPR